MYLFKGRLLVLGFGSIGQAVLPLILRHIDMPRENITILTGDLQGQEVAAEQKIAFACHPLTQDNYENTLASLIGKGDFLLNLSVNVSSEALIEFCQQTGAYYLDTCIEPWAGRYIDPSITATERSNYRLREEVLALRKKYPQGPTALIAHGANPGLVSHFVKKALLIIAEDIYGNITKPSSRDEWSALAQQLGVKVIQVAERDAQESAYIKARDEFVNTWSVDGFVSEGLQPAELGWGSHEKHLPKEGVRHGYGCDAAIYLNRPGASVRVRSWTPEQGPYHGFLIAHNEAISLADYLSCYDGRGTLAYRPTVYYAYHPCDDTILSLHEFAGKNWTFPHKKRIMVQEISSGIDELGVLLMGHPKGAFWYGSRLSIEEARGLAPYNNATSLQVASAVLAGMMWILENPYKGIVEAEDMDFERILEIAAPYLGSIIGAYTTWTPLEGRQLLFAESLDATDPWQFHNFQVS